MILLHQSCLVVNSVHYICSTDQAFVEFIFPHDNTYLLFYEQNENTIVDIVK